MKRTVTYIGCDNPGCQAVTEGDGKGWWINSLHQRGNPGMETLPKDATAEEIEKARWIIRDLCPACGERMHQAYSGLLQIVFRRRRASDEAEDSASIPEAGEAVAPEPAVEEAGCHTLNEPGETT